MDREVPPQSRQVDGKLFADWEIEFAAKKEGGRVDGEGGRKEEEMERM